MIVKKQFFITFGCRNIFFINCSRSHIVHKMKVEVGTQIKFFIEIKTNISGQLIVESGDISFIFLIKAVSASVQYITIIIVINQITLVSQHSLLCRKAIGYAVEMVI